METKVFSLKRNSSKLFAADEKFWNNVKYMMFHSVYLEIKLKRGRSINYLHHWFFEIIENEGTYTETEKQEIYKREGCSYRFPKENEEFLDYLYEEAKKRKILEYATE